MKRLGMMVAAAALALAGGASAQTLRLGVGEDPDLLDPHRTRLFVTSVILEGVCDQLLFYGADRQIAPQLATAYSWSADYRTLTLDLRRGVRFHDGEPFDAAAVKFNLDRALTLPTSSAKSGLGPIAAVEAPDDHTVRIVLSEPYAPLLITLATRIGMILSPKAVAAAGDAIAAHPVCAGPFKFVERVANDHITVEKFADYWDKDNVRLDRVVYQVIPDPTVRFANLRAGALDMIERMAATDYPLVAQTSGLKGASVTAFATSYVEFNQHNGPRGDNPLGRDPRMREAFELALDRDAINQVVFDGLYLPSNQWMSPEDPYYAKGVGIPARDVARARSLMAAAGTPALSVEMIVINTPENRRIAEMIQAMEKEAGFDIKVRLADVATAVAAAGKGDYDVLQIGYVGNADPDSIIYQIAACDGAFDFSHHCNPELDAVLKQARAVAAPERRAPLYAQAAALMAQDRSDIFLYARRLLYAHSAKVSGFAANPTGVFRVQDIRMN